MTTTINASNSGGGGLVQTADASGVLALQTAGTTAVTIDASQNVGIGTSSPSSKLHVVSSSGENKIISEATAASQQASLSLIVQAATPGQTVIYMGKTGATTNGQLGYDPNTNAMTMYTNNTERMRIDSSGNVGIGTTTIGQKLVIESNSSQLRLRNSTTRYRSDYTVDSSGNMEINSYDDTGSAYKQIKLNGIPLIFSVGSEAMRIDSSGNVLVAQTSQTSTEKFGVTQSATGSNAARFYASSASYVNNIVEISCARSGATTEYNAFCVFDNNTTLKMLIRPNGNLLNSNNSYGSLSDVSLKENIVDATPKLDNLMQVKVRNYNLKDDVNKIKQIGVIAQELETVFPGMIETDGDGIKAVKYSVFVPMLVKAIQEQQALITSLTARIAALEGTQP